MKKIALLILAAMLLAVLVGCQAPVTVADTVLSFESVLDYTAVSGIGLLDAARANTAVIPTAAVRLASLEATGTDAPLSDNAPTESEQDDLPATEEITLSEETKNELLTNLKMVEEMLGAGIVKSEMTPSDREGYTSRYTLTTTALDGTQKVYEFHYVENEETPENTDDDDDDEKDDKTVTTLSGIVILDGNEYEMRGERETKNNKEEYSFLIRIDEETYVEIEQETKENAAKYEFSYTLYQGGEKVYETEVEFKLKENGSISLEFSTEANGQEYEYEFKFTEKDGEKLVSVEVENNDAENEYLIRITTDDAGETHYEFISAKQENSRD